MKNIMTALVLVVLAGVLASPAFALACGDQVTGTVTLTQDLNCVNSGGLIVMADNTTINLNGHTMSCTGSGFEGSCQNFANNPDPSGPTAIWSSGHSGITVNGPGTITGFHFGIDLQTGQYLTVKGVNVTGPPNPAALSNTRGRATGIYIGAVNCPVVFPVIKPTPAFTVTENHVSNQNVGISIGLAGCGLISNNVATHNVGGMFWSFGIELGVTTNTTVYNNTVTQNGRNATIGGGIHLNQGSTGNHIISNYASNNCGNGISTDGSSQNTMLTNTARFNGQATLTGECLAVLAGTFHDLAQLNSGVNTWNANNTCRTQTSNIAAGVCNSNE